MKMMSDELIKKYDDLLIEKSQISRGIVERQQNIKKLLFDINMLYQSQEEFKCQKAKIGGINKSWQPVQQAIELWSSAENMEELQGVISVLKQKKASLITERSSILSQLQDLNIKKIKI
ncbi:uncharacterized protein LOC124443347 [Xenia sp. Carnegie-2017]|uniref:uncharacterized protein LOC124443347 n=1 Tax=Xenia sp. Carnegie-2017 TaxID=2897299 RepID=UPI001F0422D2|nr:uncharacterized protein LOC124443347 [Xenia sp. Carnegie-2017]